MCVCISGTAEMSRISNRIATIGAALIIILLVILLVILWSDVRNVDRIKDFSRIRLENSTVERIVNEMQEKQASLYITTMHPIITVERSNETIEQNLTNEGKFPP